MRTNVDAARDRILNTLRQHPATLEDLRASVQVGFSAAYLTIALEELLFERMVAQDENKHYFLTHNNYQHE